MDRADEVGAHVRRHETPMSFVLFAMTFADSALNLLFFTIKKGGKDLNDPYPPSLINLKSNAIY